MSQEEEPAASAAERFDDAITAIEQPVIDLKVYSERTRHLVWAMGASVVLIIILMAMYAVTLIRVNDLAHDVGEQADLNSNYLLANCQAANESRADQRKLWGTILGIAPETPRTKSQAATVARIEALVADTFAARDCSKVAEGKVR